MMLIGVRRRSRPRRKLQLEQDVADMPVDGALTDGEPLRDRSVPFAFGQESEHLQLARSQDLPAASTRTMSQRVDTSHVGHRGKTLEYAPSGVELQLRCCVVAELPTGLTEHDADAGGIVRSFQLLPQRPRLAQ